MTTVFTLLFALALYMFPVMRVDAQHVLPYPSYMPGNKLYSVSRVIDRLKKYWYWGDIASFRLRLGLSDKYLVEAKTLFDYKQYLLATDALIRSDAEFSVLSRYLAAARRDGKDIRRYTKEIADAASVHEAILTELAEMMPETYDWTPEQSDTEHLPLRRMLTHALEIRMHTASEAASL